MSTRGVSMTEAPDRLKLSHIILERGMDGGGAAAASAAVQAAP